MFIKSGAILLLFIMQWFPAITLENYSHCKCCAASLLAAPRSKESSSDISEALASLGNIDKAAYTLKERFVRDAAIVDKLGETIGATDELRTIMKSARNVILSDVYHQSLQLDAELLQNAIERSPEPQQVLTSVSAVAADLSLKAKFSKTSRGDPFRLIQVVVRTISRSIETGGYEIWYVPKGWADAKKAYKRFDVLSSPSIMELPPGNYFVWAVRDKESIAPRPLSLGDDGKSKRIVDLPVK